MTTAKSAACSYANLDRVRARLEDLEDRIDCVQEAYVNRLNRLEARLDATEKLAWQADNGIQELLRRRQESGYRLNRLEARLDDLAPSDDYDNSRVVEVSEEEMAGVDKVGGCGTPLYLESTAEILAEIARRC